MSAGVGGLARVPAAGAIYAEAWLENGEARGVGELVVGAQVALDNPHRDGVRADADAERGAHHHREVARLGGQLLQREAVLRRDERRHADVAHLDQVLQVRRRQRLRAPLGRDAVLRQVDDRPRERVRVLAALRGVPHRAVVDVLDERQLPVG